MLVICGLQVSVSQFSPFCGMIVPLDEDIVAFLSRSLPNLDEDRIRLILARQTSPGPTDRGDLAERVVAVTAELVAP